MISVIIPAARSQEKAQVVVDEIYRAWGSMTGIQVIVSSPGFHVADAVNLKDEVMLGPYPAWVQGRRHAQGVYIAWLSDETHPTKGCFWEMIRFIDEHPFPFIGDFDMGDGAWRYRELTYSRWGMMRRDSIERIGFFDPSFKRIYADVDLGLRCWKAGGAVELCPTARMIFKGDQDVIFPSTSEEDQDLFKRKWPEMWPE